MQTSQEELRSTNEESQSMNEELQTVNQEMQAKVDELSRAGNEMKNLLDSTDIATLFLDQTLLVRRFRPAAVRSKPLMRSLIAASRVRRRLVGRCRRTKSRPRARRAPGAYLAGC